VPRRCGARIRATRPMLGERLALLGDELKWLGAALGSVRDLDVLLEHLQGEAARLDDGDSEHAAAIIAVREEEREQARDVLLADLDSERYTALLERFSAAIASLPDL